MLFFSPPPSSSRVWNESEDNDADTTPWIESIHESKSRSHQTPARYLFSFWKSWAEREVNKERGKRKKRGDGMETLSSVACKLYEYLYFAIVFRLSVEERVKRNWASSSSSSSSLIIAHFISFSFLFTRVYCPLVYFSRIVPFLLRRREDCISNITKKIDRGGESDIKIAEDIQRGYKNQAGC